MRMEKKKVLLAVVLVALTMVLGEIVSVYAMNRGAVEDRGISPAVIAETVQPENAKIAQAQLTDAVQADKMTFACDVPGCTHTEAHQHGLCGIAGCTQIGEHQHSVCGIAGCTETGTHMHDGEYCYPHSADDGHAYHTCGVSGCTKAESHMHNYCGASGYKQTGAYRHGGGHHHSGHH